MKHGIGRMELSAGLLAGGLLVGCGGEGTLRIDSELADSAALAGADQLGGSIVQPAAAGTLTLDRVRVAVSELELEGEEEEGDEEFETGARVVEIALDSTATEIVAESVPAGRYVELGLELMLADGSRGAAYADFDGGSIVVDGTFDGAPFTYRSSTAPELEFALGEPAEVPDGGEARIAVMFDVAAWFLGPDGLALDPSDPANRPAIEANILDSMAAVADIELEDDDHAEPASETTGDYGAASAELEADKPKPKKCSTASPGLPTPSGSAPWLLSALLLGAVIRRRTG
ncbi:MAG: hypothetical protein JRI23_18830 [Deltaproteobacteria bacterium]|jgi:MYXO-CTERM domain-containing protein|nr:hypothetical protein [Deltaproteobacteria bacterium]MBW2533919.1 hypothetical protein [Deltaproteobacteria bacterium]